MDKSFKKIIYDNIIEAVSVKMHFFLKFHSVPLFFSLPILKELDKDHGLKLSEFMIISSIYFSSKFLNESSVNILVLYSLFDNWSEIYLQKLVNRLVLKGYLHVLRPRAINKSYYLSRKAHSAIRIYLDVVIQVNQHAIISTQTSFINWIYEYFRKRIHFNIYNR